MTLKKLQDHTNTWAAHKNLLKEKGETKSDQYLVTLDEEFKVMSSELAADKPNLLILGPAESNRIWQQRQEEHGKSKGKKQTELVKAMSCIKGLLGDPEAVESMKSLFKETGSRKRRRTLSSSSSSSTESTDSTSGLDSEVEKSPPPSDEEVHVELDLEIGKTLSDDEVFIPEQQDTPKSRKKKVSKNKSEEGSMKDPMKKVVIPLCKKKHTEEKPEKAGQQIEDKRRNRDVSVAPPTVYKTKSPTMPVKSVQEESKKEEKFIHEKKEHLSEEVVGKLLHKLQPVEDLESKALLRGILHQTTLTSEFSAGILSNTKEITRNSQQLVEEMRRMNQQLHGHREENKESWDRHLRIARGSTCLADMVKNGFSTLKPTLQATTDVFKATNAALEKQAKGFRDVVERITSTLSSATRTQTTTKDSPPRGVSPRSGLRDFDKLSKESWSSGPSEKRRYQDDSDRKVKRTK